jgi:hypothetical protein
MMQVEQHFTMLCLRAEALGGGSPGAFPLAPFGKVVSAQVPLQQGT